MKKKHFTDVEKKEVHDYGSTKTTIRWLITKEDGAPRFAMRRFEIEPGGQIGIHGHPEEHEIYILSGKGEVFSHFEKYEVKENDVLYVSPNEYHGYKNTGDEPLIFICVIPYLEK
ncbi:MAG: cupin domain-containing protein [Candidatus Heimdallarchaeaceae archaeon]